MAMTLITTNIHTGDSDTVSTFDSGIDSTYKLYIFKFIDINPATDGVAFAFQGNAVGGSDYNETITSSYFQASHDEGDVDAQLQYRAPVDQAQGAGYQNLNEGVGNGADESCAGTLWLFNPSNTTYVKHFYARLSTLFPAGTDYAMDDFCAGYFNTTTAIDDIQFKMSSGNFDGTIKMYGVG